MYSHVLRLLPRRKLSGIVAKMSPSRSQGMEGDDVASPVMSREIVEIRHSSGAGRIDIGQRRYKSWRNALCWQI